MWAGSAGLTWFLHFVQPTGLVGPVRTPGHFLSVSYKDSYLRHQYTGIQYAESAMRFSLNPSCSLLLYRPSASPIPVRAFSPGSTSLYIKLIDELMKSKCMDATFLCSLPANYAAGLGATLGGFRLLFHRSPGPASELISSYFPSLSENIVFPRPTLAIFKLRRHYPVTPRICTIVGKVIIIELRTTGR